jgi:hypothetical protein
MASQPGFASCRAARASRAESEEPAVSSLAPGSPTSKPASRHAVVGAAAVPLGGLATMLGFTK